MNFKLSWHHFDAPTPKLICRFGAGLVAISTSTGGVSFITGHPIIGGIVFVCGAVGKFLLSFFAEDNITPAAKP